MSCGLFDIYRFIPYLRFQTFRTFHINFPFSSALYVLFWKVPYFERELHASVLKYNLKKFFALFAHFSIYVVNLCLNIKRVLSTKLSKSALWWLWEAFVSFVSSFAKVRTTPETSLVYMSHRISVFPVNCLVFRWLDILSTSPTWQHYGSCTH